MGTSCFIESQINHITGAMEPHTPHPGPEGPFTRLCVALDSFFRASTPIQLEAQMTLPSLLRQLTIPARRWGRESPHAADVRCRGRQGRASQAPTWIGASTLKKDHCVAQNPVSGLPMPGGGGMGFCSICGSMDMHRTNVYRKHKVTTSSHHCYYLLWH